MDIYGVREIDDTPLGTYFVSDLIEAQTIAGGNLIDGKHASITRYRITRRLSKALLLDALNNERGWFQKYEEISIYKPEPVEDEAEG